MIQLNNMTKKQKAIAGVCIFILVLSSFLIIRYRENIFVQKIEIMYPDGCKEIFKNGVAVTPLCIMGRAILANESIGASGPIYIEPKKPTFDEEQIRPNITIG